MVMSLDELLKRIEAGENLTTEFKVAGIHVDDLAASLVAFANTSGGAIIFGVSDKGGIVGIDDVDALGKMVDNASRNNCLPAVTVLQEPISAGGRNLLIVHVPQGDDRPYSTNRGVYYVRTFSGRRQASREELLRIFQGSQSLNYEEQTVSKADLKAIDHSFFEEFLLKAYGKKLEDFQVDEHQLLANLRLAKEGHPTLAGLLLFGREPQAYLPHAQVNAAQIAGTDISVAPADRKDLTGKLSEQLEGAMRFLSIHLRVRHEIKGIQPERFPELPAEALREALVNALIHRDYTIRGPARLLVYDDRIEVRSPGKPPNTVDVEAMRLGTHVPRNPVLLSHFAKLGYVTSLGSGIPRLLRLVKEQVGREPDIQVPGHEVVISIPRIRA
jgi:ATP-dependent DNA helicase RecG